VGLPGDDRPTARGGSSTPAQRVQDYLKAIRRRWPLVVGLTLLAVVVAVTLSARQQKQYDATSKVMIERTDPVNNLLDNGSTFSNDPERDINTGVAMITLDDVADRVRRRLHIAGPNTELLKHITTSLEGTSDIVGITARDPSPTHAAALADAFANEYAGFRRDAARERFEDAAKLAQAQLKALSPTDRASAQGRALQARLQELQINSALQTGGVRVIDRATVPTSPATPKPLLSGFLAGFLALLVSATIAILVESLDRRFRDESEVEADLGLPVIASIPRPRNRARATDHAPDHQQAEALTTLATNLRFLGIGGTGLRTVLVTSAGPSEGKTSVTLGLARSLAVLRRRVIAIEADLRRPTFAQYLQLGPHGGLAMTLAGLGDIEQELIELDAVTGKPIDPDAPAGADVFSFGVLPAGRTVANPHRILSSVKMREVVSQARDLSDFLLIDTPPVGTVTDALSLATAVDAALVIVRVNKTRRDGVRRTLRLLENVGVDVPGIVLTGAAPSTTTEYDYYAIEPQQAGRSGSTSRRRRAAARQ
jgi:succinoglycan biosynthesis transport protein ExoP